MSCVFKSNRFLLAICISSGVLSIVASTVVRSTEPPDDYTGYKLYEIESNRSHDLQLELEKLGYENWHTGNDAVQVLVAPDKQKDFERTMTDSAISYWIVSEDVADAMAEEKNVTITMRRSFDERATTFNFDHFPRYDEIVDFIYDEARRSKHANVITIGKSFEGKELYGLRIGSSVNNPSIFVDAGIHAREWAAPITALYFMKKMVDYEDMIADKVTIYIIPLANPDGYEFSHKKSRFWRKTRSVNRNNRCRGVDGNRNFDSHWAEFGVNLDPCSSTYPGSAPFTEPETIAIRDAIIATKPSLYLTLHSYGPLLLYPWGFTNDLPSNWEELHDLATLAASRLKKVNGQDYTIGSSTNVLYAASGGSDDWAMEKANVPLVYTMELPNYGKGFIMPPSKIRPMVTESFALFRVFVKYVCAINYTRCL